MGSSTGWGATIAHGMWCGQTKNKGKQASKQTNSARRSVGKWLEPQKAQQQAGWGAGEITAKSHPKGDFIGQAIKKKKTQNPTVTF